MRAEDIKKYIAEEEAQKSDFERKFGDEYFHSAINKYLDYICEQFIKGHHPARRLNGIRIAEEIRKFKL